MKNISFILICTILFIGCERSELVITDTSVDYSISEINSTRLSFELSSLDIENEGFTVSSFTPNTSCCLNGSFTTDNTVDASINGVALESQSISVDNQFLVTLENISEGMNYFTIELDNGKYKKYFSFQFNLENDAIDYLMVIKNSPNDNISNYNDAIFRFDIHTDSTIRILTETEAGINVLREQITNETNEFKYITSVGATTILKTSRERL